MKEIQHYHIILATGQSCYHCIYVTDLFEVTGITKRPFILFSWFMLLNRHQKKKKKGSERRVYTTIDSYSMTPTDRPPKVIWHEQSFVGETARDLS